MEIIEKMKAVTEQFFKLPLEEKMEWAQPPDDIEGYGHLFVFSEDQKLDWADVFFLYLLPVSQRKMRLWPEKPASFRYLIRVALTLCGQVLRLWSQKFRASKFQNRLYINIFK